jgi:hypothetical protein
MQGITRHDVANSAKGRTRAARVKPHARAPFRVSKHHHEEYSPERTLAMALDGARGRAKALSRSSQSACLEVLARD